MIVKDHVESRVLALVAIQSDDPFPPQPTVPANPSLRPADWMGLVVGASSLLLAVFLLRAVAPVPYGLLFVNLGMVWGVSTLLRLSADALHDGGNMAVLQFLPFLAWPFLVRRLADQNGTRLPLFLDFTVAFTSLCVASALGSFLLAHRRSQGPWSARAIGIVGTGVALILVGAVLATNPALSRGGLTLFILTDVAVVVCLVAQWFVARRMHTGKARRLAAGPALAIAGTQLFDGIVTYLAVVDPLGLAPGEFQEQVPLSRLILEASGIGYPVLKWALAIGIGITLEATRFKSASHRVGVYLLLFWVGLGPALFSGFQLL